MPNVRWNFFQWLEQEARRLADEKLNLEPLFSDRARLAALEQTKFKEIDEWESCMETNWHPDIRKQSDIETYLALWYSS